MMRIVCFFSFLFCFAVQSVGAMELSSLKEFTDEEITIFIKDNLQEIPRLVGLLLNQEKLFDLYDHFVCEQIGKDEYIRELKNIDAALLHISKTVLHCPERLKVFINPITQYIHLLKNQKNPLSLEQKISIIKNLRDKYVQIKNRCTVLIAQMNNAYRRTSCLEIASTDEKDNPKKNRHLISKQELGFMDSSLDSHFCTFMHNICRTLEIQGYLAEVIVFVHQSLKELDHRLTIYRETLSQSNVLEKNENVGNIPNARPGEYAYIIKKPKSLEACYVAYIIGGLSKDPAAFDKLGGIALSLINHQNEEIRDYAKLALAKSNFDRALDHYIKLVKIFLKIYDQDPIMKYFETAYQVNALNNPSISFLPCSLFRFMHLLNQANNNLNEVREYSEKLTVINGLLGYTEEFLNEYKANQKTYATNYKRLKDTLRSLMPKCPTSQLYTMTRYLNESSLEPYCLETVLKGNFLSDEEIQIILRMRKNKPTSTTEDVAANVVDVRTVPEKKQKNIKKVQPKKKKRSRRKNQGKNKKREEASEKENPETKSLDQKQTNSQKIRLADKKIAKKIVDSENNMTLSVCCMKDPDPAAGKLIIYDDRVQQWFTDPQKALAQKGFAEHDPRRDTSIPFHSFAKDIDKYALKWGFKRAGQNNHGKHVTEIYLPGFIEKDGTFFEGLFVYVIDVKMLCYHRFFTICDWHQKLADEWQVDFEE